MPVKFEQNLMVQIRRHFGLFEQKKNKKTKQNKKFKQTNKQKTKQNKNKHETSKQKYKQVCFCLFVLFCFFKSFLIKHW